MRKAIRNRDMAAARRRQRRAQEHWKGMNDLRALARSKHLTMRQAFRQVERIVAAEERYQASRPAQDLLRRAMFRHVERLAGGLGVAMALGAGRMLEAMLGEPTPQR